MGTEMKATTHHVGCAVNQLEEARLVYAGALGVSRTTRSFDILSQHTRVCFVELANNFYLELVAPLDDRAKLGSFFKVGFYHLCFLVEELSAAREHLRAKDFFAFPAFNSEAFAGGMCQFFASPDGHLIELAQMSPADFSEFFRMNLETKN
jgi:hypothetical protein